MISLRLIFFFFKQKTAYEMRISDWSSDVCSSDLGEQCGIGERGGGVERVRPGVAAGGDDRMQLLDAALAAEPAGAAVHDQAGFAERPGHRAARVQAGRVLPAHPVEHPAVGVRSEEHTSALQSLMRISYAVFCLTQQKIKH